MALPKPEISQPQQWWQILATSSAELPFRAYFDELRTVVYAAEEAETPSAVDLELLLRARVAEPMGGRWANRERASWGEDAGLIAEWFEAGDDHRCGTELVMEDPEPDRWERALGWMRSLAVATKLIPA